METIEDLRRQLEEEQRRREEAESRANQNERRRDEEQHRREEAEKLAIESRPQALQQYIEACHGLDLAAEHDLSISDAFFSKHNLPSLHQMEYVKSLVKPISSEIGLRDFERDIVENAVEKLIDTVSKDTLLRRRLGIRGTVTFESHTNLGASPDSISEPIEHMAVRSMGARATASASKPSTAPKARRKAKGKGNRADQFCIYKTADGQKIPTIVIEYKAPHKLSVDEVVAGLESGIEPERDVINQDGEGFSFTSRRLAAAVVTQLFSYMIGKGIQYGYVCTGQVFIFLHILDDPSVVYYSTCIPKLDVMEDDETRLHRTAVAQVFAFILQALRSRPPLESIPTAERKSKRSRRWKGFKRSPIRTRSKSTCQQPAYDDNHTDDDPPSPSPHPRSGRFATDPVVAENGGDPEGREQEQSLTPKQNIQDRPFCTHSCLKGLACGGPMDDSCPNRNFHGQQHVKRFIFLPGARGSLFKVRLSSHGYTFVAKGMETVNERFLRRTHIPLVRPWHYDGRAGRPILEYPGRLDEATIVDGVTTIFNALHNLCALYHDAEPRNILCNENGKLMAVDLERAKYRGRQALIQISPNRKRKRDAPKLAKDDFAQELTQIREAYRRSIRLFSR
ncbi:uncharacterized protein F5Z01DRAFT_682434 [Emericellopsis atlantica]|uniref:Protein kinase domain-containing protein n=1 Tax=Emericellopsis atlantica TaxID=2614577 RepID=A0A9P8CMX6_9HYPO|nr:uncharacterized protein F5Z01DRAFT_682434 [Emericellopsis atlantica]KAG9252898.1 hypothetical protein F5Z01DRAFT_682434 [Emericellopsis atlantica]